MLSLRHLPRVRARRLAFATLALLLLAGGGVAYAAFSARALNTGNQVTSGTVKLSDNDSGAAMLSLSNAQLGDSDTSCVKVTSDGTLDSLVSHYATVSGTLGPYLDLKVTRGTGGSTFDSCADFTPDTRNYVGKGAGVLYAGRLSQYPTSAGTAITDPADGSAVSGYATAVGATSGLQSQYRLGDPTLATDTFTDTAGTTLASHNGGPGLTWTSASGMARTAQITSGGRLRRQSGTGAAQYTASGPPPSADYRVEADVVVQSLLVTDVAGVIARATVAGDTYYFAAYDVDAGAWRLSKVVSGTTTVLGSYAQAAAIGQTYTLGLEVEGTQIALSVNGTTQISVTDGAIAAAGAAGVRFGSASSTALNTDTTGLQLDNIKGIEGRLVDATGFNHGNLYGGTGTTTGANPGDTNAAMSFDGVDDYATLTRQIADDFTIEFWLKSTQGIGTGSDFWSGAGLVHAEVNAAGNDFGMALRSDGRIVAGTGSPDASIVSTAGGYNDGAWHHVAFTRTKATGALALYVDGALAASGTGGTASLNNPPKVYLGRLAPGGGFFEGSLDEVALYTSALSAGQLLAHYQAGMTPETWTTGESHAYKFQATVAADSAAYGKSATASFTWLASH